MSIIYNKWFLFFVIWIFYIQTTFSQWTSLSFPSDTDTTSFFNTAFFLNKDTGYIGGYIIIHPGYVPEPHYGAILKTENGGINWSLQTVSKYIQSIFFINNETGYAAGDNSIYKTTDNGNNWSKIYSDSIMSYFFTTFFTNVDIGFVAGSPRRMLKTIDEGYSWFVPNQPVWPSYYTSIFFPTNQIGYAVGCFIGDPLNYAIITKTIDGGNNWITLTSFIQWGGLETVFFIDSLKGWVGGSICSLDSLGSLNCNFQNIFKTTDGGVTWDTLTIDFQYTINDICFVNENTGYIADDKGYIYKTKDSGNSWEVQYFADKPIRAIYCIDENICYAVGDSGLILKTINGGELVKEIKNIQEILSIRPNPFNSSTEITFSLEKLTNTKLYLTNIFGITVKELINQRLSEGIHKITISDSALAPGIYYCILEAETGMKAIKLVKL